jgi:hypothetical protein
VQLGAVFCGLPSSLKLKSSAKRPYENNLTFVNIAYNKMLFWKLKRSRLCLNNNRINFFCKQIYQPQIKTEINRQNYSYVT